MALLSREDLRVLTAQRPGWHVSMFMPMHRAGTETQQNPIRCKNMLRQAEEQLLASGMRAPEAEKYLEPVRSLITDNAFWQHQSDGLAIFLAPDLFLVYCLPSAFDELAVVTHRFHLKPLLPLLSGDGRFYVLALSQNQVKLFQCTRHSVAEVELTDVPSSLAEALKYDDPERQLQFHTRAQEVHTGSPATAGRRAAIFHGHGVGIDDTKDNLLEYFRQIDRGLQDMLRGEDAPLVLASVDYYVPLYRQVTTYPQVVAKGIAGNPEGLRPEDLHAQAWPLVEPVFHQAYREAVAAYQRYAGTGRTAKHLQTILAAAYQGRIETLFVALGVQQWGTFNPTSQEVQFSSEPEPTHEDLLDFAAIHTLVNRGTVYAVTPEQVPEQELLAALFRY